MACERIVRSQRGYLRGCQPQGARGAHEERAGSGKWRRRSAHEALRPIFCLAYAEPEPLYEYMECEASLSSKKKKSAREKEGARYAVSSELSLRSEVNPRGGLRTICSRTRDTVRVQQRLRLGLQPSLLYVRLLSSPRAPPPASSSRITRSEALVGELLRNGAEHRDGPELDLVTAPRRERVPHLADPADELRVRVRASEGCQRAVLAKAEAARATPRRRERAERSGTREGRTSR